MLWIALERTFQNNTLRLFTYKYQNNIFFYHSKYWNSILIDTHFLFSGISASSTIKSAIKLCGHLPLYYEGSVL
jgi:hypothetical protein